jgi:hypothetical protein
MNSAALLSAIRPIWVGFYPSHCCVGALEAAPSIPANIAIIPKYLPSPPCTCGNRTAMARTPRAAKASPAVFGYAGQAGHHRILFRGEPPGRHKRRTGRDDERLVRSGQHVAHGIDGALVDLSVLREFRKIVDEGQMDCAIRFFGAFAKAKH